MKFKFDEHPSICLFLISLVILGVTIFINILYQWKFYAVIAIVLAGVAVLVLGYSMVKDLTMFFKKKNQYDETHKGKDDD